MEVVFAVTLIVTLLAASTASPVERSSTPQPIRGTDGPDIRLTPDDRSSQPVKGVEGPGIR